MKKDGITAIILTHKNNQNTTNRRIWQQDGW